MHRLLLLSEATIRKDNNGYYLSRWIENEMHNDPYSVCVDKYSKSGPVSSVNVHENTNTVVHSRQYTSFSENEQKEN